MSNNNRPYNSLVPGVNALGGANITITVGRGKNKRSTTLPHIVAQNEAQHQQICTDVKHFAGIPA